MNDLDVSQQIFRERHNLGKKIKKDRNYNNKKEKLNFQPLLQKLEIIEKRLAKLYLQANFSGFNLSLKDFLNYFEKNLIIRVLNYTRGNQKIASSILGIKVTT
ncbi:MAG: helix-turn-helix domain-containing protein, partial [Candidatus Aminicenantia bacterium]